MIAGSFFERPFAWLAAAGSRLGTDLEFDRERWALWVPVAIAVGAGTYFAVPQEPHPWLGVAVCGAALSALVMWRSIPALAVTAVALTLVALGFAASQWRAAMVDAPVLEKRLGPVLVEGRVAAHGPTKKGARVVIESPAVSRLARDNTPRRVRISLAGQQPDIQPGDVIRVRAILAPPMAPAAPGAFDFQRQSYFRQLGGLGFSVGRAEVTGTDSGQGLDAVRIGIARVRSQATTRILAALDPPIGAVAAALMTGQRGAIPDQLMQSIRDSGLAHLLAISGLHIGLVAAIVFFGMRGAFALIPPLALAYPIKKWAAAAAIAGALCYALVAGATIPSLRAFLMISLVLSAVIIDRRGFSMRMVACAATAILLLQPESLLSASFQMSFAAVVALIAVYEAPAVRRLFAANRSRSVATRFWLYVAAVALTTIIASTATAPFALYHFNRMTAYGLIANVIAVPVTALWIMPWAVVSFILMPIGLEAIGLVPMGWGIDLVVGIAQTVSAWPGAVGLLPAMPTAALTAIAVGGVWVCLWRTRWRLLGSVPIAAGLATLLAVTPPDILIDESARRLAVRTESGAMAVSPGRAQRYRTDTWLRRAGQQVSAPWPDATATPTGGATMRCDGMGCIYHRNGHTVALVRHAGALAEDCRIADVVISSVPVRDGCPSAHTIVDRFDLWRSGGHAVWLGTDGVRVESVAQHRGRRPWMTRRNSGR